MSVFEPKKQKFIYIFINLVFFLIGTIFNKQWKFVDLVQNDLVSFQKANFTFSPDTYSLYQIKLQYSNFLSGGEIKCDQNKSNEIIKYSLETFRKLGLTETALNPHTMFHQPQSHDHIK